MSPIPYTRVAVVIFFVLLVLGPFSLLYVPSVVGTSGDALQVHEGLFRTGLLAELGIALVEIGMAVALLQLLRPAGEALALAAAGARGGMAVVQAVAILPGLAALASPQDAAQWLALKAEVPLVWQAFFGLHGVLLGLLITRAGFVPWWLGPPMGLSGLAYLGMGLGPLVAPEWESLEGVLSLVALGELPFFVWLVVRGVDAARWSVAASSAR